MSAYFDRPTLLQLRMAVQRIREADRQRLDYLTTNAKLLAGTSVKPTDTQPLKIELQRWDTCLAILDQDLAELDKPHKPVKGII